MVSRIVALDAGPLGLVTNPKRSPASFACAQWLQRLVAAGSRVVLPDVSDYEVRRELLRGLRVHGLRRLDALASLVEYLPITTAVMRQAAVFWADARQRGNPKANDRAFDADGILAAQVATLNSSDGIVATTNVGHLSRYVQAARWRDIFQSVSSGRRGK